MIETDQKKKINENRHLPLFTSSFVRPVMLDDEVGKSGLKAGNPVQKEVHYSWCKWVV